MQILATRDHYSIRIEQVARWFHMRKAGQDGETGQGDGRGTVTHHKRALIIGMSMTATSGFTFGILGPLDVRLALGVLRLATEGRPSESDAVAVIHTALDGGVRLLDTADSYALDASDFHYGEALVRKALDTWSGPKNDV